MTALAVVILIVVFGVGTWFVTRDSGDDPAGKPGSKATTAPAARDIGSQTTDPPPLTEAEVFPGAQLAPVPNGPVYQVLKTQASADCKVAAADELATSLVQWGCTQVVRATLKSPDGAYLLTTGILNMKDQAGAEAASGGIQPIVEAKKGRLTGLIGNPGAGTESIVRAPSHLAWDSEGHFVAYCMVVRVDGQGISDTDKSALQKIQDDILGTQLRDNVIGNRARTPLSQPASAPAPSTR